MADHWKLIWFKTNYLLLLATRFTNFISFHYKEAADIQFDSTFCALEAIFVKYLIVCCNESIRSDLLLTTFSWNQSVQWNITFTFFCNSYYSGYVSCFGCSGSSFFRDSSRRGLVWFLFCGFCSWICPEGCIVLFRTCFVCFDSGGDRFHFYSRTWEHFFLSFHKLFVCWRYGADFG